ncbi:MAG: hypothetical protein K1X36_06975 [Pyrinomonadaceae bacterium]|nr:hypothetical protein [Pyrinomonadaceae bacterium]
MMRIMFKPVAVFSIVLALSVVNLADIRIRFARGRTSATVTGSIRAGGRVCYVAGARRGQTLNAVLSSRSGKVNFLETGETSYSFVVDRSGDQTLCVDNVGGSTTYTLTVSIQ